MVRQLIIACVVIVLASSAQRGGAEPPATTPSPRAALADAERLSKQVEQLARQGKLKEALALAEQLLSLREQVLGPRHLDVAASLHRIADLRSELGEYDKAVPLLLRAVDIREKSLGPSHLDLAESLHLLGSMYYLLSDYGKAEPLFLRALAIREKALGPTHPDVAESLADLGVMYFEQGAYGKAEPLFVRALAIREKAVGPMHPDVAPMLTNLGALYREQGGYARAEPLFVRALAIRDKALGPSHPEVANSLNNLGMLYYDQGNYAKAEPMLLRALAIRERAHGPMHPLVATSLNNLAMLYGARGADQEAERLYLRALNILEQALGPMHPRVAGTLGNLARVYTNEGAYDKAEPLHLRALDIDEKAYGRMHPDVAGDLNNLAFHYLYLGEDSKAEPLLLRALDIWEKAFGPTHPDVAVCLFNLAALYTDQREYDKAEPLYLRALHIDETLLGVMHPDVAGRLNGLAMLYRSRGALDKAQPLLARAAEIREAQLRTELARLSEPRRRALMGTLRSETGSIVSLQIDAAPRDARALELALTTVLRRKGRILDSLAETHATLRNHLTPALRVQLDQLAQERSELVRQLYSPPGPSNASERSAAIAASHARIEALEAGLGAASAEFRAQSTPITLATVQAALPRGAMLVELVRYQPFVVGVVQQRKQLDRYVAYLVTRDGSPQWVALGDAAPIDAAVDTALAALHSDSAVQDSRPSLRALDELVFAPIRARLTGISHVIVAPDGKLNLVPFEALIDAQGHYEAEQHLVSYVTSGRDLLRLATPHAPRSPGAIVASPDYGPAPSPAAPGTASFAPLAGARAELNELVGYFSTAPLTGAAATKRALAALSGPAILHVATHGFYSRDAAAALARPAPASSTGSGSQGPLAQRGMHVNDAGAAPPLRLDDPLDALDQAGLAMAGANQSADGIVTAREIAGFDWWGTKLVVLSACDTGVGAVASGDGVYGLRRALVLAGAESQVVSLWDVNDSSTQQLMHEYYDELARGTGRAEALRQAKLRLLREPRYSQPHYWAAFILAGDWTPLDKRVLQHR